MNRFQAIFSDLDWTIVYDRHKINPKSLIALKKYLEKGYPFIVLTGRPIFAARQVIEELHLDYPNLYIAGYNGSILFSYKDQQEQLINPLIDQEVFKKVLRITRPNNLNLFAYIDSSVYSEPLFDFKDRQISADKIPLTFVNDLNVILNKGLIKGIICSDEENLKAVVPALKEQFSSDLEIFFSQRFYLELMPKGVNKGLSLQKLVKHFSFDLDKIIVLGDNENDISMLRLSSHSFCPSNAIEECKKVATTSNKDVYDSFLADIINAHFEI